MSPESQAAESLGLNERAIVAMLSLLDQQSNTTPSLEALAGAMNIEPEQLSRLFDDSHAVLMAAAEQALVRLVDACVKAVVKVDPEDALHQFGALGEAYIIWASQHRAQFRLLSDNFLIDVTHEPTLNRYTTSLRDLMVRMLERARDDGNLHPDEDIETLMLTSRSFAYGVARMLVDDRMPEWFPGQDPMTAARTVIRDFLRRIARSSRPVNKNGERTSS